MQKAYDLAVIGAGASGLTAAAVAAQGGKSVVMIDGGIRPGAKIAVSGGGKCNFSNRHADSSHYFSGNPHFCKSALARFKPQDFTSLLDRAGLAWEERGNGKLFAFSAPSVRDFLLENALGAGAELRAGIKVKDIKKNPDGFRILTEKGDVSAKSALIATGGVSCPALGATDFGFRAAGRFGLKTVEPRPALVSILFEKAGADWTDLAGIGVPSRVSVGKKAFEESLLFTHHGFSGPAVFQASLYWEEAMSVRIDFMPGINTVNDLKVRRNAGEKKHLVSILAERMPLRLAQRFCSVVPLEARALPLAALSDKILSELGGLLNGYSFLPAGTGGWEKAEVMKGGIDTAELSSATLEAHKVPGLYFAGEIVDVTGELGGFNLHWAWASGTAVGRAVASGA